MYYSSLQLFIIGMGGKLFLTLTGHIMLTLKIDLNTISKISTSQII